MKWTFEVSDEELAELIKSNPRAHVENVLAKESALPIDKGRYGWYGAGLQHWERHCPGINERVERIKATLKN